MTEEKAKTKICPYMSFKTVKKIAGYTNEMAVVTTCKGTECMAWIKFSKEDNDGYCALIGVTSE